MQQVLQLKLLQKLQVPPSSQYEALQVLRVPLRPLLKLLKPPIQDIHGHHQLAPVDAAEGLHEVEEVLPNLQGQPLDPPLGRHVERGQRRKVLHRNPDLGRERRSVGGELHLAARIRPRQREHGGGASQSDGAAEEEGRARGLDVDGQGLVRRESEAVEEEYADLADLIVCLTCAG